MESKITEHFDSIMIEHEKSSLFGDQMIANLAFLINKKDLDIFDKKVNDYSAELDGNIKLKYTGPVPPYNFVKLNINLV